MKSLASHGFRARVFIGASLIVLTAAVWQPANAQDKSKTKDKATSQEVSEVVVTGTSFRGVQPVGSNLISVGAQEIEKTPAQTMQNVWKTIPALSNMGAITQGNTAGNSYSTPTIHNLGSSSSNSTLVLIDGHRFSPSTFQQALMDPGIIPMPMIERVEVLTDGASSTYGADAVAGVVNVITRKRFDGLQVTGQGGVGAGYDSYAGSVMYGTSWGQSSLIMAGSYSFASDLRASDRYPTLNFISRGGTNNNNFFCDPATLQPTGSGVYYLGVNAPGPTPTAQSGAMCNEQAESYLLQQEQRLNGMVRYQQNLTDSLHLNVDLIVGHRIDRRPVPRGTLQSTAFGTGAQANPFYTNPVAYTGSATTQTIRWDADALLGPGAWQLDDSFSANFHADLDWQINDNWHAQFTAVAGMDHTRQNSYGTLCGACANLALNGTTNGSGNTTLPSIPGTTSVTLQTLTPDNALDVWNPAATNRTSAAVRRALTDNVSENPFYYNLQQYRATADGKLFHLPGGDVHLAVGAEFQYWGEQANYISQTGIGPSTVGDGILSFPLSRSVMAGYGELLVPIVGPDMNVPFMRGLNLDVAARYDHYSDFGGTTNPKVGIDWEVVDGFKLHANWASSFVAPQLIQVGDPARDYQGNSTVSPTNQTFTVDTNAFPSVVGLPGCTAAQAAATHSCTIGASSTGILLFGNLRPTPATGKTWSVGFDITPALAPGLRIDANLFNNKLENMLTSTQVSQALGAPSLGLIQFFPGGMTQAQVNAAVPPFYRYTGVLPPPDQIYYVLNDSVKNFLFLTIQGIDLAVDYTIPTERFGDFNVGGNLTYFTKFDQQFKGNPHKFSVLGTTGFNGTIASVQTQGRFHLGWEKGPLQATVFMNYVSGYRNWSGASVNPVVLVNGVPDHGGDKVKANYTFDLNVTYQLAAHTWLGVKAPDTEVFLDITNIFDKAPVFYNGANGYDQFTGNPVGRVSTVGLRVNF